MAEAAKQISQNASAANVNFNLIKFVSDKLQIDPEIAGKVATISVRENIDFDQIVKHPDPTKTTGNEVVGKYYYFEKAGPGGEVMGKWDGEKFILPGEKGFK